MNGPDHRDLSAACVWATAMLAAVAVSDSVALRAVLGVPVVLLIAGHAMLRALGVRAASLPEHLAYAVGASLAAGIAGGLVLNLAGLLTPLGWAVWFWAVTLGASLAAVARGGNDAGLPPWPQPSRPAGLRLWHGVAFVLAAGITTGAYALAVRDEADQQQFRYVAFWMLPPADGGATRLVVGLRSDEANTQRFDVEVTLGGQPLAVFHSLVLAPGDTWTREVPVPVLATAQKAEARLYRPDDNRLYRSVSALVDGGG